MKNGAEKQTFFNDCSFGKLLQEDRRSLFQKFINSCYLHLAKRTSILCIISSVIKYLHDVI